MMLECNIPLNKREKMTTWLNKYVPNAGSIPCSNTLQKEYLPKVLQRYKEEIIQKIKDKPLSVIIDASPDRLSRQVVNTIVQCELSGEKFLLNTTFLDSVNHLSLFGIIDSVRQDYGLKWKNFDTLVCDSASYNKKVYKTIKDGINPKLRLMRCWTHLLDLVSDTWQDSCLNNKVHTLVAKFQQLMNKSSSRKARYLQFLRDKKVPNVKGMPTVVLSRWNTWYKANEYLYEYLPYIFDFLKDEKANQEASDLVERIFELLNNSREFAEIKLMIAFNTEKANIFHDIIEKFERSSGFAHQAYNMIMNLWNHLRFAIYQGDYGEVINNIICTHGMDKEYWNEEFQKLYKIAWKKLDTLIKGYESMDFFKLMRVFDPSQLKTLTKDIKEYELVFNLSDPPLLKQFKAYLVSNMDMFYEPNLREFWRGMSLNCPELSKLAIQSLNTPVTSVDIERSFSMYRDILSHKRCSLKLSSINVLSMANYNKNFNNEIYNDE